MKKEESHRSVSWPCDQELFITIKTWDSTSCFTGFYLKNVFLKGTVSVILSDPPCKDGKCSTSVYISVNFQLLLISNKYAGYFCRETANENRQYKETKHGYLIHNWSDKAFYGNVVNLALPSLHTWGWLEITPTVPLNEM